MTIIYEENISNGGGKLLLLIVLSILCLPHLVAYMLSKNKEVIKYDVKRWIDCTVRENHGYFLDLLYLLSFWKEFRNVFYLRIGFMRYFLQWYIRPLSTLFINVRSEKFGAGTFIQHGFATVITAESIGKDCWINQQVTIGYNDSKKYGFGKPVIGDHVRISAGAKVCGKVTIGEGAIIGLNAVVIKNVSPHSVVVPSPMCLIRENGIEAYKKF